MALDFSVRNKLTEETRSLNGETRSDTDANIRKIFGTKEDFMMTNFCSQMDSLQFINQGSTDRKKNLSKFLDLEVFEKKYRLAKEDFSDINGALKNYEGKKYEEEIEEEEENLIRVERDLGNQKHECDILKGLISEANSSIKEIEIEIALQPKINLDIQKIKVDLKHCEEEKKSLAGRSKSASAGYEENTQFLDKVNLFFNENSYDDFCKKQELLNEKQEEMKSLLTLLEKHESRSKTLGADIERTSGVPCGDKYPSCKFLQNANRSKKELPDVRGELVNIGAELALAKETIKDMDEESINRRLQNFRELIEKKSKYERQVADFILEKERISSSFRDVESREKDLSLKKGEYYKNERACELVTSLNKQRIGLVSDLEKLEKRMTSCEAKIYKRIEEKGVSEQKISHLKEAKRELANLRNQYTAFDLYKSCMDNNGISSDIIKKCLPIINDEVAKILVDIVPFEIFFEIEERKLEIYIRHPKHEPRLIEMASGAEKTIAAMAIRLALIKVGNLPTSDIFILDEPATALDAENMEGFIRILDMLKTQFKTVILISHLDILKECVDSEILIEKKKGFAYVDA
jgi:DNA repair exonuclease SbcCD ATPase subunit